MAEFFIENARLGRILIIETHSDLLIRRVLRGILTEEASQSQVGIYAIDQFESKLGQYFQHPMDGGGQQLSFVFSEAKIEPIKLDDTGRIVNWPMGFLDIDDDETGLMLDALMNRRGINHEET